MTVGGLFMSAPVTVQAVKFEDCEDSGSHIRSSQVAAVDGQLTVTIDIDFETQNGQFHLFVFDKQLEKVDRGYFQFYDVFGENTVAKLKSLKESGTYTFDGLAGDKSYYVYCNVEDNHEVNGWGENEDPNETFWHYAAYLGTNGSGSNSSDSSSSDSSSSGSSSSDSSSSDSVPSDSAPADSDDNEEELSYEDRVVSQIEETPSGSTFVMEEGISALPNSVMQELLEKGDVSLKLEFTYQDKEYVIVIPAGAALDNDIPWYGPLYLAQHFGNRAGTAASGAGGTYEVQSGDTMSKIAAANNMTLQQLLAKNPQIKDANKIVVGQKINR